MSLWIAALRQEAGRQGLTAAADRTDLCHDYKDSDEDVILAVPGLEADHVDASLFHEAAIGKIAGEQLIKLMTLGMTAAEAEEQIINGFLQ